MAKDDEDSKSEGEDTEKKMTPEEDPFLFHDDPMTVLCNLGLKAASTFCFPDLAGIKSHMKAVHGEDPSIMKGNSLFKRFQVCIDNSFVAIAQPATE